MLSRFPFLVFGSFPAARLRPLNPPRADRIPPALAESSAHARDQVWPAASACSTAHALRPCWDPFSNPAPHKSFAAALPSSASRWIDKILANPALAAPAAQIPATRTRAAMTRQLELSFPRK